MLSHTVKLSPRAEFPSPVRESIHLQFWNKMFSVQDWQAQQFLYHCWHYAQTHTLVIPIVTIPVPCHRTAKCWGLFQGSEPINFQTSHLPLKESSNCWSWTVLKLQSWEDKHRFLLGANLEIRKSFLKALFIYLLISFVCVCDQCLHQPILVVLHFRGVLQSGQCCSPGALLGDVLLLTITLHHAPSGYHWFVIIAFFSSVGLIQSFSPGDFSVCLSVGLTEGVCVLVGTEHWGKREGVLKQTCCSVIFSCFLSFSIWLCGPTLSCWMLILTPASTDVPIQCC